MNIDSIFADWGHHNCFALVAIIFVSLVGVVVGKLMQRRAVMKYSVLLAALTGCLLVPAVAVYSSVTGKAIVRVPYPVAVEADVEPREPQESVMVVERPLETSPLVHFEPVKQSPAVFENDLTTAKSESFSPITNVSPRAFNGPMIVGFVWMAGTAILILFTLRSLLLGRKLRREAVLIESAELLECLAEAERQVSLRQRPLVLESARVFAPVVHGCRVPAIILPLQLVGSISREQLTDVLIHELAHIRRRDTMVVLAEAVARALFWPIATVHWMLAELGRAREEVCDNYVLANRDATGYAETLVVLAELASGRQTRMSTVGILNWRGEFEQRIVGLLDQKRVPSRQLSTPSWVCILLFFAVASIAIGGSRLVAVETPQPQAEAANPQANEVEDEREELLLRIVDWQNNPVADAEVELWQFAFSNQGQFGGGSRSPQDKEKFNGTTDAEGKIAIPYSKLIGPRQMPVRSLGLHVTHPKHPRWSGYQELSDDQIQLTRPYKVTISASLDSGNTLNPTDLYCTAIAGTKWSLAEGKLVSDLVDRNEAKFRVVYAAKNQPTWISDRIDLTMATAQDSDIALDVSLKRSQSLKGRLSDDSPRPIKNGIVYARTCANDEHNSFDWSVSAEISPDGAFSLDNIPENSHVQLIALCDGGVSRSPRISQVREYSKQNDYIVRDYYGGNAARIAPQLYFVDQKTAEVVVPMDPTGDVEVTVQDWGGNPIADADVSFSPNQAWHNHGSQVLGESFDSLQWLLSGSQERSGLTDSKSIISRSGKTDKHGTVIIRNLPAGIGYYEHDGVERENRPFHGFTVTHPAYSLVVKEPQRIITPGLDRETVDMLPGKLAKVIARMERTSEPESVAVVDTVKPEMKPTPVPAKQKPQATEMKRETMPVTVTGMATDLKGNPIAGATVHLISTNQIDKYLGEVSADQNGKYRFDVELPVSTRGEIQSGTINVYGVAEGYGFIWHGMRHVTTGLRPENQAERHDNHSFYLNEPIAMDLQFPTSAAITGQVLDENDQPVAGVTVTVDNIDYLDTNGRTMHPNFREFWGIQFLAEKYRVTKTNNDGQFELTGLPQDTVAWVNVSHSDHAQQSLYAAITDRKITEYTYVSNSSTTIRDGKVVNQPIFDTKQVSVSPLQLRVATTEPVPIQVVDDRGNPLPEIFVSASSSEPGSEDVASGTSAYGKTDVEGKLTLKLPANTYRLVVRAPRDTDFVSSIESLEVEKGKSEPHTVTLRPGCVLILKALDSETGKPIKGISFWNSMDGKARARTGVDSHPTFVDHPKTNEAGELRVVANPGTRQYGVGWSDMPEGYGGGAAGRTLKCESGKTIQVTFELRKKK